MKKIFLAAVFVVLSQAISAQMLIPKFEEPSMMKHISSDADETMPLPFNDANSFYFSRTYFNSKGEPFGQDIWFVDKKKGEWDDPYRLFRADYLEGSYNIIGTNKSGDRVYLFGTSYKKEGKEVKETTKLIYLDKKGKDKWEDPVDIKIPNLEFTDELYYTFHMDYEGKILMISMSESKNHLEEDLYVSLKQEDGSWSEVKHLGDRINTKKSETSPYLAKDKKTLYFASDGHDGLGGTDVFVSYRMGDGWDQWTRPLNLGAPINSEDHDGFFTFGDSMDIYFTSDREGVHMSVFHTSTTGEFRFANQQAKFDYAKLPAEGLTVKIYDTDGTLIDEVQTDVYGNFTFKKLEADEYYLFKIDETEDEDFIGSKVYFVNEQGKKTSRFIYTEKGELTNSGNIIATKHIKGSFNYKELPMKGTALLILDEKGFPIDTIYTDENGKFDYKLLTYDTKFSILPVNLTDEELGDLAMHMENNDGQVLQNGYFDGEKFRFRRLNADGSDLAQGESIEEGFIKFFGRFNYKNLPMANTALVILDENGLPLDTIYTDAFGNFNYNKLDNDKSFSITPLDLTDVGYDELEMVLANENGTVIQRGLFDGTTFKFAPLKRDDFEIDVMDLVDKNEEVVLLLGEFNYKDQPMSKVALLVLDEDGFPIDTIYTDANGKFDYEKLANDKEFTIIPLNLTDEQLNDLSVNLLNKGGKIIEEGKLKGKGFVLEGNYDGGKDVIVAESVPVEKKAPKIIQSSNEIVGSWSGKGSLKAVVYFDFAVNDLSESSKQSLDKIIASIKGGKIILIGHTDNIGTVENNEARGLERANSVKKYLESKGLTIDRIELSSKGEEAPIAPNDYEKGRAKNRRVEVVVE